MVMSEPPMTAESKTARCAVVMSGHSLDPGSVLDAADDDREFFSRGTQRRDPAEGQS